MYLSLYEQDAFFMKKAIIEAKKAFDKNEVPIGALIVAPDNKTILSKAYNLTETKKCQSAHAEILAIEKACRKINDWRLNDCTLYVTLEPCAMCMNLILLSRIKTLVFALQSKLYGFSIDKYNSFQLYNCPIQIREDVCKQESLDILKLFFKEKRIKQQ